MISRASSRLFATSGAIARQRLRASPAACPTDPPGGGCIAAPRKPCPSVRMSINALRSSAQRHCPPQLGIVEGRLLAVDDQIGADAARRAISQIASGACFCRSSFISGIVTRAGEGQIVLAGDKGQDRGRPVLCMIVYSMPSR